jgi:D-alanyl-D-alanine carboxypeptidase
VLKKNSVVAISFNILIAATFLICFFSYKSAEAQSTSAVFDNISLLAQSAAVYDPSQGGFLFQKNGRDQRPLASITKLLTAYTAKQILADKGEPTTVVSINTRTLLVAADFSLEIGQQWDFNDLMHFMLMASSNSAADNIAHELAPSYSSFISKMNVNASTLGTDIHASDASGLAETYIAVNPKETEYIWPAIPVAVYDKDVLASIQDSSKYAHRIIDVAGDLGSAEDVAILMDKIGRTYPDILSDTTTYTASFTAIDKNKNIVPITATSTDTLLQKFPQIIGGKTGYTDLAGGNLAVVIKQADGNPLIIVVLGSTVDGRFDDVEKLINATLASGQ